MSTLAELQKSRRRHRLIETALERTLAAGAIGLAAFYILGLAVLMLRGGHKVTGFTVYPSPLLDVRGEDVVRFMLAASIFGSFAWGASALVERLAGSRWTIPRAKVRIGIVLVAVAGALLFRDHLPRFLISLPSDTTAGGGVGPEIFNTLYAAVMSTAITLPVGIGAAVYLARFAGGGRFVAVVRMALDTLASLPSIVYGLFGFLVFVVEMKAGYSLLAGAFVLALLNLPLVVGIAEESIRAVPGELEDASLALGATRVQTTLRVTIPYAWSGILSALVLSIGRVFAESAPLVMTAGTTISRADAYSLDPMRGGETLAVHLWYVNSAGLSPDRVDVSAGTAAVLIVLIGATNFLASRLAQFGGRK